ncbi:plasmid mobilization relaxosome protein MobC [Kitasatospora aureofaciens]|uniref:plasmid mobilization protein n=1 Tax=Kitasatospora aureofaciens TaxID=1894 RepID=UPI0033A11093
MVDDGSLVKQERGPVRRRVREGERRTERVRFWWTETEMEIVRTAAERDNQAVAAWVAEQALAVAAERVVPVSPDLADVLRELIRARAELSRIGNNANQIARALNSNAEVTAAQLDEVLARTERAVKRMDEATVQLMRERRRRS